MGVKALRKERTVQVWKTKEKPVNARKIGTGGIEKAWGSCQRSL